MAPINLNPQRAGLQTIGSYLDSIKSTYLPGALYRGHANCDWHVIASAFRPNNVGITSHMDLEIWKDRAQRLISHRPADDIEYLVLAQHFGVPTALLDWTSNPLTALFFASLPEKDDRDGMVLQTNVINFERAYYTLYIDPFALTRAQPILFNAAGMNVRSTAQDSFMSLHTKSEGPIACNAVFTVPNKSKYELRRALEIFGFTQERLYMDLGVAGANFADALYGFDALLDRP